MRYWFRASARKINWTLACENSLQFAKHILLLDWQIVFTNSWDIRINVLKFLQFAKNLRNWVTIGPRILHLCYQSVRKDVSVEAHWSECKEATEMLTRYHANVQHHFCFLGYRQFHQVWLKLFLQLLLHFSSNNIHCYWKPCQTRMTNDQNYGDLVQVLTWLFSYFATMKFCPSFNLAYSSIFRANEV